MTNLNLSYDHMILHGNIHWDRENDDIDIVISVILTGFQLEALKNPCLSSHKWTPVPHP